MKDKVSPMRRCSARSGETLNTAGEKRQLPNDGINSDGTPVKPAKSNCISGLDLDRKENDVSDKPAIEVTDLENNMIELTSSPNGIQPQLSRRTNSGERKSSREDSLDSPETPRKANPKSEMPKSSSGGFMKSASKWNKLRTIVKTTTAVKQKTKRKANLQRQDSFLKKFSTRQQRGETEDELPSEDANDYKWRDQNVICAVIHPDGTFMFYWLSIVTIAVLYNWWTCIAREGFREILDGWEGVWFSFDGICDVIYVLDIVVQFRTGYLEQGLMVYDGRKLRLNYYKSSNFYLDLFSLFPLDLIQIFIGIHPMVRFPRFLKTYRTLRFMYMLESRAAYPNLFRVANLTHLLFLGSHWFAAFYYLISEAEGFVGDWAYPYPTGEFASVTRKYLMSLYWSTLTLTTIGDLPPPDSNWEYVFVIVSYLIGVFVFATIVGQVGNVITNRNASRQEFEKLLDGAKSYMRMHNVPPDLQKRVQRWYDYVWSRGRLNGSWDINSLGLLPDKLKTELALHVNLETLKKVTIFQECQPEFLHDLVLKMKAYIFTPGDLICRSGEIAREMFIIADGVVEVISESGTVLTQMSTGDFFGEIGILNLDGGINRRTADVRSVGYSELFVLSREDVLSALKDHPDAENIIRDYGQKRLQEIEADRQKIKTKQSDDEDDDEQENDSTLLSPFRRHVRFNSFSPMMAKRSKFYPETKDARRRKSCSVDYYQPKPINGLVDFLQRKLSTGSAYCGVFQNPQLANQSRLHGSGPDDTKRRASSLASSNDSIGCERESGTRNMLSKSYELHPPPEHSVIGTQVNQRNAVPSGKHPYSGVSYSHLGSEEASDSESSMHGVGFSECSKLLPVKESVQDDSISETLAAPLASADGFSSNSDTEIHIPRIVGKTETSTKIANVFIHHLVNVRGRRKSYDSRSVTNRAWASPTRRKSVYDVTDTVHPVKARVDVPSGRLAPPNVPTFAIETVDEDPDDPSKSPLTVHSSNVRTFTPPPPPVICGTANNSTIPSDNAPHNTCTVSRQPESSNNGRLSPAPYDMLGLMPNCQSGQSTKDKGTLPDESAVRWSTDLDSNTENQDARGTDFRLERMMGDVQGLIVQKLGQISQGYQSKVQRLEEEIAEKDDKIQDLELKVRDLQVELSMVSLKGKS